MADEPGNYDSSKDTLLHIQKVQRYMLAFATQLIERAMAHDASKLESPEKEFFDRYTPLLASLEYGSLEYGQALEDLRPALGHHYKANSHHPEHYMYYECGGCFARYSAEMKGGKCPKCGYDIFEQGTGVYGMNLLDIVEMLCDWKAASERHQTGNFEKSLEINAARFNLQRQLVVIFENTGIDMGWIKSEYTTEGG